MPPTPKVRPGLISSVAPGLTHPSPPAQNHLAFWSTHLFSILPVPPSQKDPKVGVCMPAPSPRHPIFLFYTAGASAWGSQGGGVMKPLSKEIPGGLTLGSSSQNLHVPCMDQIGLRLHVHTAGDLGIPSEDPGCALQG
jgi:hypothetical protein